MGAGSAFTSPDEPTSVTVNCRDGEEDQMQRPSDGAPARRPGCVLIPTRGLTLTVRWRTALDVAPIDPPTGAANEG